MMVFLPTTVVTRHPLWLLCLLSWCNFWRKNRFYRYFYRLFCAFPTPYRRIPSWEKGTIRTMIVLQFLYHNGFLQEFSGGSVTFAVNFRTMMVHWHTMKVAYLLFYDRNHHGFSRTMTMMVSFLPYFVVFWGICAIFPPIIVLFRYPLHHNGQIIRLFFGLFAPSAGSL